MKLFIRLVFTLSLVFSYAAVATPFPSIDPSTFGADFDGDGYFAQIGSVSISVEAFDAFDSDPAVDLEFGLFFEGASSDLFTIFGSSEDTNDVAVIDFANGVVVDLEDSGIESLFAPSSADFGFYLSVFGAGGSIVTVFSDPALNGGLDHFGAFSLLLLDSEFPGAFAANFYTGPPELPGALLYVAAMIPLASVDEPQNMLLFFGASLLIFFNRRRLTAKS